MLDVHAMRIRRCGPVNFVLLRAPIALISLCLSVLMRKLTYKQLERREREDETFVRQIELEGKRDESQFVSVAHASAHYFPHSLSCAFYKRAINLRETPPLLPIFTFNTPF